MVTGWRHSIELAIRHVRQPDQRMPVAAFHAFECPSDARPRQPSLDHRGLIHIKRIIQINEVEVAHGPIARQGAEGENEAPDQTAPSLPTTVLINHVQGS